MPIVRAKRLTARGRGPGLMKIEVPSLEHKLNLLRNSWKLKDNAHNRNVFIHSSKSHAECIAELNSWMIVEENGWQNRFKMASNGRLKRNRDRNYLQPQQMNGPGYFNGQPVPFGGPPPSHFGGPPPGSFTGPTPGHFGGPPLGPFMGPPSRFSGPPMRPYGPPTGMYHRRGGMRGFPGHRGGARGRGDQHVTATGGATRDRLSSACSSSSDNIHVNINNS